MPNLSITSQPPPWTATSTILYPPLVARFTSKSRSSSSSYFAMAILMGSDGVMVEGALFGSTTATGVEAGGRSGTDLSFHFADLYIAYEGTYYIRVDVYKAPGHDYNVATLSAEVNSNQIVVTEG
ncbi:hypothetical protein LCI18_000487 [Fusarium solani-melongenae]|uniref:Uncharacterized protein n=1 Tax=Fusarium solani subsp. cucurbitae TaxID=2747967 RepID=A0ACD3YKP6_FUSSC|nr:hypothetical protein LCI18_000487 [Fusarium solani-melongenae]